MFGKVFRGAGRLGPGFIAFGVLCALTSIAAAQPVNGGVRWIGAASDCVAPASWEAQPVFFTPGLPAALAELCLYTWTPSSLPKPADLALLFSVSGARDLTEDVPVVVQNATFSSQEKAFLAGLRDALRSHVGDASLLPSLPAPRVRIVVVDSAPDAPDGLISPGTSRHGDTLAHLIEDIVCLPDDTSPTRACAAEVTSALALDGGIGTLSQLARAIERAVSTWEHDRRTAPSSTPGRLLLNLSLGWEHTRGIADCSTEPPEVIGPPARAVFGILRHAASRGALIVAAAGNDSGGSAPRSGLLCPGLYQAVPRGAGSSDSLVVAVSGVDYQDRPLENARPQGITAITGLGLGGVAWKADSVPPPLTGSSVSTAVVSAVGALVWAHQPAWQPAQVVAAVYDGGLDVGAADACPLSLHACRAHRVSVCGALTAAGASPSCTPAPPGTASTPALPGETAALLAAFAGLSPIAGTIAPPPPTLPRYATPTIQIQPWVAPMPVAETCPVCVVAAGQLVIRGLEKDLEDAVLVLQYADGTVQALSLQPSTLVSTTPYSFLLPPPPSPGSGPIVSAYLTGLGVPASPSQPSFSVTEQIFVQP